MPVEAIEAISSEIRIPLITGGGAGHLADLDWMAAHKVRVAVHPAFQRRGIGQALMAALEGKACQRGIAVRQLDTSQSQVAA